MWFTNYVVCERKSYEKPPQNPINSQKHTFYPPKLEEGRYTPTNTKTFPKKWKKMDKPRFSK